MDQTELGSERSNFGLLTQTYLQGDILGLVQHWKKVFYKNIWWKVFLLFKKQNSVNFQSK